MVVLSHPWLRVVVEHDTAVRHLICFPHAGGGPQSFATWAPLVDTRTTVLAVNPPGRNERAREAPIADLRAYVTSVADALANSGALALPYVFFGHSLGALIAYEVARALAQRPQVDPPMHVVVSSEEWPAAVAAKAHPARPLHAVADDAAFVEALARWGVLPDELAEDASLQRAVVPALRADITLYESYTPIVHAGEGGCAGAGVGCPALPPGTGVSVVYGVDDASVAEPALRDWGSLRGSGMLTDTFAVVPLVGGHFYFSEDRSSLEAVVGHVCGVLDDALARRPVSIASGADLTLPAVGVAELVNNRMCVDPKSIAVVDVARGDTSYDQLWLLSRMIAAMLEAATGMEKDMTVGLMLPHSTDYVCGMLGTWIARSCMLVLEQHHPPDMLLQVCASKLPDVILTTSAFLGKFTGPLAAAPKVLLDGGWDADPRNEALEARYQCYRGSLSDRAILMTTSGTGGMPKLIEGDQRFLLAGMLSRDTLVPYAGVPHSPAKADREACSVMFVWEAPRALIAGHVCVVIPESVIVDPVALVDFLVAQRCTRILTTPSLAAHVFEHLAGRAAAAAALQETLAVWFLMGEVCTASLMRRAMEVAPRITAVNAYSTWEAADTAILRCAPEHLKPYRKFYPVGYLHDGVRAAVVDPDTRTPVPRGVPGELYTAGPQLSNGYVGNPALTESRFVPLPWCADGTRWYKSGDRAVMHVDGCIELQGRIDSTVKIRGFKVGLPFVEGVLADFDGVAIAVVVPTFNADTEQPDALAALLSLSDDAASTSSFVDFVAAMRKRLTQLMPRWAVPSYFLRLEDVVVGNVRMGGEAKKVNRRAIPRIMTADAQERQRQMQRKDAPNAAQATSRAAPADALAACVAGMWYESLNVEPESSDPQDNFFDLGGHSLMASTLTRKLSDMFSADITVLDLYEHATLAALTAHVRDLTGGWDGARTQDVYRKAPAGARDSAGAHAEDIAIIGIAGVFPGADSTHEFFDNLRAGRVSATHHTDDGLRGVQGMTADVLAHEDFVKVAYKINDADKFDARFFGIGRAEAATMDPQHRVFLETAWHAVEDAGYAPRSLEGLGARVGVFAAGGIDGYLVHHLHGGALRTPLDPAALFMTEVASEKDYIATRVSYLLGLRGPSMAVNSACSSGIVAIAQACAAIHTRECDMAIAGASSVSFPNAGYLYQEGLVYSRDGRVRPLDEGADGTVFGDSVGAIVLKRLSDAERDGDDIYAVVKGYGVSNDGAAKAGYAAPSAAGQADCIVKAMSMAGVGATDVDYVEMHATGTLVGDGIEAKGLRMAWDAMGGGRSEGGNTATTAVGSVKGNIGHANCAAGLTGLLKTVLMLRYETLVPTAGFERLNSKVQFEGTPFYVNTATRRWERCGDRPRTAGVSSFGIGGTNAHVLLGEHVSAQPSGHAPPPSAVVPLVFSARTCASLAGTMRAAGEHLLRLSHAEDPRETDIVVRAADVLCDGRERYDVRAVVCASHDPAAAGRQLIACAADLRADTPSTLQAHSVSGTAPKGAPDVAFLFPGQGSQYVGMARGLYAAFPTFRRHFDECAQLLAGALREQSFAVECDVRGMLDGDGPGLADPVAAQSCIFAVEYALAQLLRVLRVVPASVGGHSIGEYAAAVIGGHLTLAAACRLVACRALTTRAAPPGAMLSIACSAEEACSVANTSSSGPWVAGMNAPAQCVVAGRTEDIDVLAEAVASRGLKAKRLHTTHAFHTPLMREASVPLEEVQLDDAAPQEGQRVPVLSNVRGGWMDADDATRSAYWRQHMVQPVRWRECMATLLAAGDGRAARVCVEVGPGNVLCLLGSKCRAAGSTGGDVHFAQTLRHASAVDVDDVEMLLLLLGQLWARGVDVDWARVGEELHGGRAGRRRLHLPGYHFERVSHWVNPAGSVHVPATGAQGTSVPQPFISNTPAAVPPARLVRFATRATPPLLRLYCFPFAGGSSRAFERWAAHVSPHVEVVAVELPGRGGRAGEASLANEAEDAKEIASLVSDIAADCHGVPCAVVGLSMGGLFAVEAARGLRATVPDAMLGLVIAGRAPPRSTDTAAVTDDTVAQYSLAPAAARATDAWQDYLLPLLKADLVCDRRLERRVLRAGCLPASSAVPCEVGVLAATEDDICDWRAVPEWAAVLRGAADGAHPLDVAYFPGGHSFLVERGGELAAKAASLASGWLARRRALEMQLLLAPPAAQSAAVTQPSTPAVAGPCEGAPVGDLLHTVEWVDAAAAAGTCTHPGDAWAQLALPTGTADWSACLRDPRAAAALRAGRLALCVPRGCDLEPAVLSLMAFARGIASAGTPTAAEVFLVLPYTPEAGALAGCARAISMEMPELVMHRVFVDAPVGLEAFEASAAEAAREVLHRGGAPSGAADVRVVLRGSAAVHVHVLKVRRAVAEPCRPVAPAPPSDVVVVTGWTGGLGRVVVEHLAGGVGYRPSQLVLLSRREVAPPALGTAGDCQPQVVVADTPCDVPAALRAALAACGARTVNVLHLAGALADGVLANQTQETVRAALAPKVDLLEEVLSCVDAPDARWSAGWAVVFSSTTSLFGYHGQANYAAANGYLDLRAHTTDRLVAVNWGPWGAVGMAREGTKAHALAVKDGDRPLPTQAALGCLGRVLALLRGGGKCASQYACFDVDWSVSPWRHLPAVSELVGHEDSGRPPVSQSVTMDGGGAGARLQRWLTQQVDGTRWEDVRHSDVASLGLDSLDTVQLRNAFNRDFHMNAPLSLFSRPNLTLLQLFESLGSLAGAPEETPAATRQP